MQIIQLKELYKRKEANLIKVLNKLYELQYQNMDYYQQQLTRSTLNLNEQLNQTENNFYLSQIFRKVQILPQIYPKTYNQLVTLRISYSPRLFQLKTFPQRTIMAYVPKQQEGTAVESQIPVINKIRKSFGQTFTWYQKITCLATQLILKQFLYVHQSIKSNQTEYTRQKMETQENHNMQLLNYKNDLIINNIGCYHQRLNLVWKLWKKYYLFFINTNRKYVKSSLLIETLARQQWKNYINKQKLMQYDVNLKMTKNYKQLNIQKQLRNIKNDMKKITEPNKQCLTKILTNLKEYLEFDIQKLKHEKFCQIIQNVIRIYYSLQQYTFQYQKSYKVKVEYLLNQLKILFTRCQSHFPYINKDIQVMKNNNQQKQQILNFAKNNIQIVVFPIYKKVLALFQTLRLIQQALVIQLKEIQLCYKQINKLFNNNQRYKFYVNQYEKEQLKHYMQDIESQQIVQCQEFDNKIKESINKQEDKIAKNKYRKKIVDQYNEVKKYQYQKRQVRKE